MTTKGSNGGGGRSIRLTAFIVFCIAVVVVMAVGPIAYANAKTLFSVGLLFVGLVLLVLVNRKK